MKRIKLVAAIAAVICLCFTMVGCQQEEYKPTAKTPQIAVPVIGVSGTLRVGVNADNPPLAGDSTNKVVGIDVDIASAIADKLGLKVELVKVGVDTATALNSGTVDIVMGTDSAATDEGIWRSASYLNTAVALFAATADTGVPVVGTDVTIAAQVSSLSSWTVTNVYGANALRTENDLSTAFTDLRDGRVKYVASDAVIGSWASHVTGIDARMIALMSSQSGYSVAVKSSNADLVKVIETTINSLISDGSVKVLESKWLGSNYNISGLPVTANPVSGETVGN